VYSSVVSRSCGFFERAGTAATATTAALGDAAVAAATADAAAPVAGVEGVEGNLISSKLTLMVSSKRWLEDKAGTFPLGESTLGDAANCCCC
jgi:hypothetical protein